MRHREAFIWATLVAAAALSACMTDVSRSVSFGTQGSVVTGLVTGSAAALSMAAGRDRVFWADVALISYCPRSGQPLSSVFYISGAGDTGDANAGTGSAAPIGRMVTDDQNLYWTELANGQTEGGRVLSTAQDGASPATAVAAQNGVLFAPIGPLPLGFLTLDQGQLYWATQDVSSGIVSLDTCPSFGCPCEGGVCTQPRQLPLPAMMTPLGVYDGRLYGALSAADSAVSSLVTCPATGPCDKPTQLAAGVAFNPTGVVVDGSTLYFDSPTTGSLTPSIFGCTLPDCPDTQYLFNGPMSAFAARNGTVYWQAYDTGAFAACSGSACADWCPIPGCVGSPADLDVPFSPVAFPGTIPPPTVVPDANGAYAYASYGPSPSFLAIVYLAAPP